MVKELDDPAGDELAVVLDARVSAAVGSGAGLELRAGGGGGRGTCRARARRGRRATARRGRRDGEPAGARERTAVRRLLARVRPAGERPPADLLTRLAAERIEVVTTPAARLVGAGAHGGSASSRSTRRASIRLCRAMPTRSRRCAPRAAACSSCGGPSPSPWPQPTARGSARSRCAAALYALAGAFGLLARARPADARALDARGSPRSSSSPPPRARGAARRAAARPARAGAGGARRRVDRGRARGPHAGAPLGGLAGQLPTRPAAWVQVVLPFAAASTPSCARRCCWRSSPGSRRSPGSGSCGRARSPRPCSPLLPFAVSATVYDLPQYPWRALLAGTPAVRVPVHRPRGRRRARSWPARSRRSRSQPGWAGPRCRLPRARRAAVDDVDVLARRRALPTASISSGTCATGRSRSRPSPSRSCRCALRGRRTGAPWCCPDFDGLRFTREPQGVATREQRRSLRVAGARRPGRRLRAEVRVEALSDSVPGRPGQPVRYEVPPRPGRSTSLRTARRSFRSDPRAGPRLRRRGRRPDPSAARAAARCRAAYPARVGGARPGLRRRARCRPFGAAGPRARAGGDFPVARGDPTWTRLAGRLRQGAPGHARRGLPVPGGRRARGLAAHHARLRRARGLPDRPDALARWAASGQGGLLPDVRRLAGRARAARRACRPAWPRASRRATGAAASTT